MSPQRQLISRKKLELILQELVSFYQPTPDLEQYPLNAHSASLILAIIANTYNDIHNRTIADLGCGTGIIAIGTAYLGAHQVIGVDIDSQQLEIAVQNAKKLDLDKKIRWINCDVKDFTIKVEVIIQNPPFGVQRKSKGMDVTFLIKAIQNANIIYSIHKSGEKIQNYLRRIIKKENAIIDAIIPIQIRIPHLYSFHIKKDYPVKVDLYRIISP
ncbi:MAG: METTL5 family protein [Candidatus Helarchaeota archaeon]